MSRGLRRAAENHPAGHQRDRESVVSASCAEASTTWHFSPTPIFHDKKTNTAAHSCVRPYPGLARLLRVLADQISEPWIIARRFGQGERASPFAKEVANGTPL